MKKHFIQDNAEELVKKVKELHFAIRDRAMRQMREAKKKGSEELSRLHDHGFGTSIAEKVYNNQAGDVMYKIDVGAEEVLDKFCSEWGKEFPLVLISEATGITTYPKNTKEENCYIRMIVDVLDGTRPLMYDMDSAFSLTGIAPNKGKKTSLNDIEIAVQTEIPTTRQYIADIMYAIKGKIPVIEEWNLSDNKKIGIRVPRPTQAETIEHGFAMITKFFRGKDISAGIEEELFRQILGPIKYGKADVFDHEYISSAGQMAHLINGKYRFTADIRPFTEKLLNQRGDQLGLCAHPYDLCTKLIGELAGIIITDIEGNKLNAPLDTKTNVGWIGYANQQIRDQVEKPFLRILEKYKSEFNQK